MKTITILTCDRQPSYLDRTVATIPDNYTIQYVAQGQIVLPRAGDLVQVDKKYKQDNTRHRDSKYNYSSALLNTRDGLIIEDDVQLSRYFDTALNEIVKNIPTTRYAVALYSTYKWHHDDSSPVIAKYPVDIFFGTQAMLYDMETARKFGTYLLENIDKGPYDIQLKTFIKTIDTEVALYVSKSSLVQHIGDISTGIGRRHQCSNFLDDISIY